MNKHPGTKLARPVGLLSLTAIAVNGVVGAGIFVLPATVATILGPASPLAYLIAWLANQTTGAGVVGAALSRTALRKG